MKKILLIFLLLPVFLAAQRKPYGSIYIQSPDKTSFYLELDGKRINTEPLNRIWVYKLPKLVYSVKIISASDESITFEREKFFVCNKEKEFKSYEYKLTSDNNRLKFKFISMKPYKNQPNNIEDIFSFDLTDKLKKIDSAATVKSTQKKEKALPKSKEVKTSEKNDTVKINNITQTVPLKSKKRKVNNDSLVVKAEKRNVKTNTVADSLKTEIQNVDIKPKTIKSAQRKDSIVVEKKRTEREKKVNLKDSTTRVLATEEKGYKNPKDSIVKSTKTPKPTIEKDSIGKIKKEISTKANLKKDKPTKTEVAKSEKMLDSKLPEDQKLLKELVLVEPTEWACDHGWPMHKANFAKMLDSIGALPTESEKIKKAKELASKNCLFTEQVFEISSKMNNQEIRFEWIKFAYKYTIDIINYSKLGVIFTEEKQKNQFYYFITH